MSKEPNDGQKIMVRWCLSVIWEKNPNGKFDSCSPNKLIQFIPILLFWIILPSWIYMLYREKLKQIPLPISKLFFVKLFLTIYFLLVQIVRLFVAKRENDFLDKLLPLVYLLTSLAICCLIEYDRRHRVHSSGLICVFWFFVCSTNLLDLINSPWVKTLWFHWIGGFASLISHCFAEGESSSQVSENSKPRLLERTVSFPSRIFYNWVTPLIRQGFRKPLTETDCWQVYSSEQTKTVVSNVEKFLYQTEKKEEKVRVDPERESFVQSNGKAKRKTNIFWRSLVRTYADKIIAGGLLRFTHDMLQLVGPLILKLLLKFLSQPEKPMWLGIFYGILLSLNSFCQTIVLRAQYHCNFTVGLRFRAAITGLIYRKSLKLSNNARQKSASGEIINMMAIDSGRFAEVTQNVHILWTGPIQLAIILTILYQQMQFSIVPGLLILLLMIPINSFLQRIQKKLTSRQILVKDQRIKMMNEILNGIRVLKLNAWEEAFIRSISKIRNQELTFIQQKSILNALSTVLWTFTPMLVTITTFTTYVLSSKDHVLTAEKAFVSLALFNLLRAPLSTLPNTIGSFIEGRVANQRIQNFLNNEQLDENSVERVSLDRFAIRIENGLFSWSDGTEGRKTLKNVNVAIEKGSLVAIVGPVAGGKSSFLSTLLGEMNKIEGNVFLDGNIAYVPQTPWIINDSFRENILFGRKYDEQFYKKIVESCDLNRDLEILPSADETEIGEKGINLSGGQRQRVSLARALYSNADVYLLDDPLSAVDAHVGSHIFKKVLGSNGFLKEKTRLWVTHGVSHLSKADRILVIANGEIVDDGKYDELMDRSTILKDLVRSLAQAEDEIDFPTDRNPNVVESKGFSQEKSTKSTPNTNNQTGKIIEKEKINTGSVKLSVFMIYIRACTLKIICLIVVLFSLNICASLGTNIWLSKWTDHMKTNSTERQIEDVRIYATIGLTHGFISLILQSVLKLACCIASRRLHWLILLGVFHAPMSFFDTTPMGRILNRFGKDIDSVDTSLPTAFTQALHNSLMVLSTFIVIIYGSKWGVMVLLPLVFLFIYIQRIYVSTSRQLRRLDSVTRSFIYIHFGETLQGLSSIRAYQVQQRYIDESDDFTDRNHSCHYASSVANRWLGIRLEMIANGLTLFTAIVSVLTREMTTVGTVGLMISYTLQVTNSLNAIVRMSSEIETNIVGVERIHEYSQLESEAPWTIDEKTPSPLWPKNGQIEIKNLSARFRENLPLVLKNLSLQIQSGEKVGIIGRTGSGKSTLCLALFRMIEPSDGQILIDQIDVREIGLHDLRRKITIIPQDAIIFAGTVRFNVDPFGNHSDMEIWNALELVHLKNRFGKIGIDLSFELTESGQNLSAGERQLLCLARALLRKTKIFILDEATAAIDMETDRLIQSTIRSVLKDATVLTIAHRLHTILDSDKILVLSDGSVAEFDRPQILASNPNSAFSKLLLDANINSNEIPS